MSQIRSMTGFGRGQASSPVGGMEVEIRTWNHRFLDVQLRLPDACAVLDTEFRKRIERGLERGRVEVTVRRQIRVASGYDVRLNESLLRAIAHLARGAARKIPEISEELLLERMLARSEVFEIRERHQLGTAEIASATRALDAALAALDVMRSREGRRISRELSQRCKALDGVVAKITKVAHAAPKRIQAKLHQRLEQLLGEGSAVDAARLATEVAVIADRIDIAEELSRLGMHLAEARRALLHPPAGKRLDFLLQELLREINTVGSKASDGEIATLVVSAKVELERFREQVQNVE